MGNAVKCLRQIQDQESVMPDQYLNHPEKRSCISKIFSHIFLPLKRLAQKAHADGWRLLVFHLCFKMKMNIEHFQYLEMYFL